MTPVDLTGHKEWQEPFTPASRRTQILGAITALAFIAATCVFLHPGGASAFM